ncbi:MAG: c-type cytochrome [Myxococcales bacterium]|nr:c-type cytochrome [Myxococcales bacterium]
MRKVLKILGIALGVLLLGAAGLVAYLKLALPDVGAPPPINVERTPSRIARGKYLANHVLVCIDCHSRRDWKLFSGPIIAGSEGEGGEVFDETFGFPGRFVARNITPFALAKWSDGELYRLITTGVDKNGEPIFPVMPYGAYGKLDPEDVKALIAYLRTLPSITKTHPPSKALFPVNLIMRTFPRRAEPMKRPAPSDVLASGRYLVTVAACTECHTRAVKGKPIAGMEFAGGFEFPLPNGTVRSANITPDPTTGIGKWTKEQFVARFKSHPFVGKMVEKSPYQTVMPWTMYSGMTTGDLEAIFTYLRTRKPIENLVQTYTPKGR